MIGEGPLSRAQASGPTFLTQLNPRATTLSHRQGNGDRAYNMQPCIA